MERWCGVGTAINIELADEEEEVREVDDEAEASGSSMRTWEMSESIWKRIMFKTQTWEKAAGKKGWKGKTLAGKQQNDALTENRTRV